MQQKKRQSKEHPSVKPHTKRHKKLKALSELIQESSDPMHKTNPTNQNARERDMNRSRHGAKSLTIKDSREAQTTWTSTINHTTHSHVKSEHKGCYDQ